MSRAHARIAAAALLAAATAACTADRSLAPDDDRRAPVTVRAAITGTPIEGLGITVSGPGIASPVVANIPAAGATATGTIQVPTGRARLFTVRGFDGTGIQTHEGTATADIRPGTNPSVNVRLYPITASAPISVTVGSYTLTLTPGDGSMVPGATRQYTAAVTDVDGAPVPNATVVWASLDPTVAVVSTGGMVTALAAGQTRIVASVGGVAAQALLTVSSAGGPPAGAASCASPGGTAHAGAISASESWAPAGNPHRLTGSVTASGAGVVLTLEPGVLVCAAPGAELAVSGTARLLAHGTAQQPVRLTSAATTPAPGDWRGVRLDDMGTPGASAGFGVEALDTLRHVVIEYAGGARAGTVPEAGLLVRGLDDDALTDPINVGIQFDSVTVRRSAGAGVRTLGRYVYTRLLGSLVEGTARAGTGDEEDGAGVVGRAGFAVDSGTIVRDNAGVGVLGVGTFRDVTITGNGSYPIVTSFGVFGCCSSLDAAAQRRLTGNVRDTVVLRAGTGYAVVGAPPTHLSYAPGLVYRGEGEWRWIMGRLVVDAGVTIAFAAGTGGKLLVGRDVPEPEFEVAGTATLPVRFTSTAAQPGAWEGIELDSRVTSTVTMRHAVVEYATTGILSYAALALDSAVVRRSAVAGIDAWSWATVVNSVIARNAEGIHTRGHFTITQSSVAGNGLAADGFTGNVGLRALPSDAPDGSPPPPVVVSNVWWGDPTGAGGLGGGAGDLIVGDASVIQYSAPLTASPFPPDAAVAAARGPRARVR